MITIMIIKSAMDIGKIPSFIVVMIVGSHVEINYLSFAFRTLKSEVSTTGWRQKMSFLVFGNDFLFCFMWNRFRKWSPRCMVLWIRKSNIRLWVKGKYGYVNVEKY